MKILLSNGLGVEVDEEDFIYLSQWIWTPLRSYSTIYAARGVRVDGHYSKILMHRVIAERMGLNIQDLEVDHKDGNGRNNLRSNLQALTKAKNQQKMVKSQLTHTGVRGVTYNKRENTFVVRIQINGNRVCVGTFKTLDLAVAARLKAEERYHGARVLDARTCL